MPTTTSAVPYPLDFDALQKGSVVSTKQLEEILEVPRTSREFAFKALPLRQQIELELAKRGRPATVVYDQDTLRVLTDEEAVDYNVDAFEAARRKLGRAHARMLIVDRGNLTAEKLQDHDRQVVLQAQQLVALKKARRLAPAPQEDTRPSMLSP